MDPKMFRAVLPLVLRSFPKSAVSDPRRPTAYRSAVQNYSILKTRLFGGSAAAKSDAKSQAASSNDPDTRKVDQEEGKRSSEPSEVEKTLREELDKAVAESATLLSQSRDFEVCLHKPVTLKVNFDFYCFNPLYLYQDKYKRALAETENLRTRLTKQINDSKLYAIQGFCKDITEVSLVSLLL